MFLTLYFSVSCTCIINLPSMLFVLQDGMNSVELAVVGGHIDLVRDLVDNFKASIDFSTDVRAHVYST